MCDQLAAELEWLEIHVVESSSDPPECSLTAEGATDRVFMRGDPSETIRAWMMSEKWAEDITRSADGPGTSSFALVRSGVECTVSMGAPSYLEDGEIIVAEEYGVVVKCGPDELGDSD